MMDDEEGGTPSTNGVVKPQFKKRGFKGKIREACDYGGKVKAEEGTNAGDDDVDKQKLDDLRKVRELKKRRSGTDVAGGMNKAAKAVKGSGEAEGVEGEVSGIGANMKSQFSSNRRMYDDPIGSIAHKDIMEKYVEEKLGLTKSEGDVGVGSSTTESASRRQEGGEEENEQAGFYTGIAEVELDESYKIKNIQETEKSLREMAARRKGAMGREKGPELGYGGRFTKPKSRADYIEAERRQALESAPAATVALPPGEGRAEEQTSNHQYNKPLHKGPTSSDTRMLNNYKARQKY